eukprot:4289607-Amphidinium_carterae.1
MPRLKSFSRNLGGNLATSPTEFASVLISASTKLALALNLPAQAPHSNAMHSPSYATPQAMTSAKWLQWGQVVL